MPKLLAAGSNTGPRRGAEARASEGGDQRTTKCRSCGLSTAVNALASSRGDPNPSKRPAAVWPRSSSAMRCARSGSKYSRWIVAATCSATSRGGAAHRPKGSSTHTNSRRARTRGMGGAPRAAGPSCSCARAAPRAGSHPPGRYRQCSSGSDARHTVVEQSRCKGGRSPALAVPRGTTPMSNEPRDLNRDPITGAPGSHPVGVGVGGTGGAVAGAAVGSLLGPIGTLIGGAVGALAGAAAGKGVAERLDPTGEAEYWRVEYANRPYTDQSFDYDSDYAPAYRYGLTVREQYGSRVWDDTLEAQARLGWESAKDSSRLSWDQAREAVRDAFDRSDRTYRAYEDTDRYYADQYATADYYRSDYEYETDYRPAYRYGTYARNSNHAREWDDGLEADLERNWGQARGSSRMEWSDARHAVRDAWHRVERALPGDADGDGR